MKKSLIAKCAAAILSLTIIQATPVYAMHKHCPVKCKCIFKQIEHMKKELDLTPAQEKQLNAIKEKAKKEMQQKHETKHAIHKEAHDIAQAKTIDNAKLNKLADKACQNTQANLKARVMVEHDIYQILTEKQKTQLEKARHAMHKKNK